MDQGIIRMFKVHFLQKCWRALSLKCDVSLDELEKALKLPRTPWKFKKTWCGGIGGNTPSVMPFSMSEMPGGR